MMSTCGMNTASKNMDFLTKHWAPFRRKYPSLFRLVSSDFIPEKSGWVRTRFGTCNFSIILRGEGRFERAGKSWPVQAPCVITQWPGESVAYGPTSGTWSEWYLVYNRAQFRRFREHHLVDPARPVWPIADPASLRMHLAEFRLLARSADPAAVVGSHRPAAREVSSRAPDGRGLQAPGGDTSPDQGGGVIGGL